MLENNKISGSVYRLSEARAVHVSYSWVSRHS